MQNLNHIQQVKLATELLYEYALLLNIEAEKADLFGQHVDKIQHKVNVVRGLAEVLEFGGNIEEESEKSLQT